MRFPSFPRIFPVLLPLLLLGFGSRWAHAQPPPGSGLLINIYCGPPRYSNAVFYVDGKLLKDTSFLDPNSLLDIKVIRGEAATRLLKNPAARAGAIILTTEAGATRPAVRRFNARVARVALASPLRPRPPRWPAADTTRRAAPRR